MTKRQDVQRIISAMRLLRFPDPQRLPSTVAPKQRTRIAFGKGKKNFCGSMKKLIVKET